MERIYVDFNTLNQDLWSEERRVRLDDQPPCRLGARVILFDEELEVEAVLEYDEPEEDYSGGWWGRPDWATHKDLPSPQSADVLCG